MIWLDTKQAGDFVARAVVASEQLKKACTSALASLPARGLDTSSIEFQEVHHISRLRA